MSANVDDYIKNVIALGDEGSDFLNKRLAPTLKNSRLVDVLNPGMGGQRVLRVPEGRLVVVHSAAGEHHDDLKSHAASLIDRLVVSAWAIHATPIALADVVDASTGARSDLECIAEGLVEKANYHGVAVLNGELAILGSDIIAKQANVSGTMISFVSKNVKLPIDSVPGTFSNNGIRYAVFDAGHKAVSINSDGVGTKVKWYEMIGEYQQALYDSVAMKVDDSAKSGAKVMVIADVVETTEEVVLPVMEAKALDIGNKLNASYILQFVNAGNRLKSYNGRALGFNVSGSAVCVIDEERLCNPLKPSIGDYVVAIRGKPNPRSNGITSKRKIINEMGSAWCQKSGASEWHQTSEGKQFLEFLAQPSTVLYPVFMDLIGKGFASSVYHISGGAYNGKFARPLAKHGLFAQLKDIFSPDWREMAMVKFANVPLEKAYAQWPMGNDGFVTTSNPVEAMQVIQKHGLEAKVVGRVESGRTGVELVGIKASDGKNVYFSGG